MKELLLYVALLSFTANWTMNNLDLEIIHLELFIQELLEEAAELKNEEWEHAMQIIRDFYKKLEHLKEYHEYIEKIKSTTLHQKK